MSYEKHDKTNADDNSDNAWYVGGDIYYYCYINYWYTASIANDANDAYYNDDDDDDDDNDDDDVGDDDEEEESESEESDSVEEEEEEDIQDNGDYSCGIYMGAE
ncbi:hypothetical protein DPMN_019722 [Dreissena polymorpha]|uniref:Uncharacterized protein n=1 Tax=Dreissena polymorpha TaxID=45954 RepID=A0A9D4NLI8_DREPO|nr:hypothetical protein DPMN_019722 [Dreissena polymorpha]